MSPQKSSKQYRSVSRCASKFYQVKSNDLSSFALVNGRGNQRRRQRRYRGQNPSWIYIRDVCQSWNLFGSGSKFRLYFLLIFSMIIGVYIYHWISNLDILTERMTSSSSSQESVGSFNDKDQCFDGDVCMIPKSYASI